MPHEWTDEELRAFLLSRDAPDRLRAILECLQDCSDNLWLLASTGRGSSKGREIDLALAERARGLLQEARS